MLTSLVLLLTWPPTCCVTQKRTASQEDERSNQSPLPHWEMMDTGNDTCPSLHQKEVVKSPGFCGHPLSSEMSCTGCLFGPPPGGRHEKMKGAEAGSAGWLLTTWKVLTRKMRPWA